MGDPPQRLVFGRRMPMFNPASRVSGEEPPMHTDNLSRWTLTDASGEPMLLSPGRTWVELARDKQAVGVPAGSSVADTPWP